MQSLICGHCKSIITEDQVGVTVSVEGQPTSCTCESCLDVMRKRALSDPEPLTWPQVIEIEIGERGKAISNASDGSFCNAPCS